MGRSLVGDVSEMMHQDSPLSDCDLGAWVLKKRQTRAGSVCGVWWNLNVRLIE